MSVLMRSGSREDLEREVLRAVKQRGYCYARDALLAGQLEATTPAQVTAWEQTFSRRAGLTCRPYSEAAGPGGPRDGVIFQADARSAAGRETDSGRLGRRGPCTLS